MITTRHFPIYCRSLLDKFKIDFISENIINWSPNWLSFLQPSGLGSTELFTDYDDIDQAYFDDYIDEEFYDDDIDEAYFDFLQVIK